MNLQEVKNLVRDHPNQFYTYLLKRPDGRPFYVGKGNCRGFRIEDHIKEVLSNKIINQYKAGVIRKIWGEGKQIDYEIVLFNKDESKVFDKEKELIKFYGRKNKGGILTNLTDGGDGIYGFVFSEESRRKMSLSFKGRIYSEATRGRMSEARKRDWISEAYRRKVFESRKGRRHSEETKRKMSISLKGKYRSEEQKRNISESLKGRHLSEEHKRKIGIKSLGGHRSEETKRRMMDRRHSEETKRKMSESQKLAWIKRKRKNDVN